MLVPDPEAPRWIQTGEVMCTDVTSAEEAQWLRAQVASEEARLRRFLEHNHSSLMLTGIAAKVMVMDEHAYKEGARGAAEDIAETYGISLEVAMQKVAENGGGPQKVDETTQFRVAENVLEDEPRDPDLETDSLYVVVYNGPIPEEEHSVIEIGSRIRGIDGEPDAIDVSVSGVPGDMYLTEREVATVGSLVDLIKSDYESGNLPHLGDSGYYDTLVVEGFAAPLEDLPKAA
ncbi:MAG TPA: hypothetical protein VFX86_03760 [Candidatus Saccharimonadales bacterium]|nr:hypothetical protein [Candidatus Saccharimonadales bacterium]